MTQTEKRLSSQTVGALPANISRPAYDRGALRAGIVHLGVGAFHRCHQAEWTDDALAAEFGPWGIVGINLMAPDLQCVLAAQDGWFCRITRDLSGEDVRLVGAIVDTLTVLDKAYDPLRLTLALALEQAADPAIRVISMTVTEKGYCHIPATGELDPANAAIIHDLAHPAVPVSVPGFILQVISLRVQRGLDLPVFISCDNVPDNGTTLRRCVLALAAQSAPQLHDLIATRAHFLNTMVDRIVPATLPEDLDGFAATHGVRDYGLVVGEPFRMWVIEKPDQVELPAWDKAGALFVPDVAPYELLKMRVLNGIQSNVCQLGALSGLDFMADVMAMPVFRDFAETVIRYEVLPCLAPVPGIDLDAYLAESIARLTNPRLKHRTTQISTDGSQKIKQRLLQPLREAIAAGVPHDGLLLGVAGWMQYATGIDHAGQRFAVADPVAAQTRAIGEQAQGDAAAIVAGMLQLHGVFGDDLKDMPGVAGKLTRILDSLLRRPAVEVVAEFVAQDQAGWIDLPAPAGSRPLQSAGGAAR